MARQHPRTPEKKQAIKDSALQLFAVRGWDGTTLEAIAEELGYTKQALYYYFGSKEDLFCELVGDSLDRARERMDAIRDLPGSSAERLGALIRLHFDDHLDSRGFFGIYHQLESFMDRILTSPRGEVLARKMADMTGLIMEVVRQGVDSGEFVPLDPQVLGGMVLSMITGVLFHLNHPSLKTLPRDEAREILIRLVLKGVLNDSV